MPTLKQDEKGQYFLDTGGGVLKPLSAEQAQAVYDNPDALSGIGAAANQGAENLVTGAGSLLSDDSYFAERNQQGRAISEALTAQHGLPAAGAQYAPQVAIGAATAGAGALPAIGAEALLGAATTPESPILGAAAGAAGAGLGYAVPGLVRGLGNATRDVAGKVPWLRSADPLSEIPAFPGGMMPGERPPIGGASAAEAGAMPPNPGAGAPPPSPSANPPTMPPGTPPNPAPRMAERVTANINAADDSAGTAVAGTRMMEGTLTPAELYARGVPTSPGQRALLTVGAGDDAGGAAARELLGRESAIASQPIGGQGIRNIHDAQQQAGTHYLTQQLGMPRGINLTEPVLADVVTQIGDGLDNIAASMGDVPITPELRTEFAEILEQSRLSHRGAIEGIINQVNKFADDNGGNLSGQQWQEVRTKIDKMLYAGQRQGDLGKLSDAGELMDTLTRAMESGLPDAARQELQQLRHQYAIAANLMKPGTKNADGQVNPLSFYNKWNQGRSMKTRGTDEVGRFMNTLVTLTQKRMPDSGTAGRLLEAASQLPLVGGVARGVQTVRGL